MRFGWYLARRRLAIQTQGETEMTTLQKVGEIITKVKKNKTAASAVKLESRLREDLDLDSIGLMEVVVLAEETFGVGISARDVKTPRTVAYVDAAK